MGTLIATPPAHGWMSAAHGHSARASMRTITQRHPLPAAAIAVLVLGLSSAAYWVRAGVATHAIISAAEVQLVATTFTDPFPNEVASRHRKSYTSLNSAEDHRVH